MSTFLLKIIASITMFIDHIGLFFPNTPLFFRYIGRISAPIFIFCTINGMKYTRNKKLYIMRLYIAGLVMSVFQYLTDQNLNFFRTLFSIALIIYILEISKKNKKYIYIYFLYQFFTCTLCAILTNLPNSNLYGYIFPALMGNIFYLEGGLIYVSIGIIIYLFIDKPIKLSIIFSIIGFLSSILMAYPIIPLALNIIRKYLGLIGFIISELLTHLICIYIGINILSIGGNIFTDKYLWMIIFSLPLILSYNGKKGKNIKYFFYFFYPLHIIILWFISNIL